MGKQYNSVQAFQTWHSNRTFHPNNPQIDPWMRDVLVSLQNTLNLMATQIDQDNQRIDDLERQVRQLRLELTNRR